MKNDTPLLISSATERPGGERGKWNELKKPAGFIRGIQTNTLADELNADLLNALVTGVPTPWARVRLFEYAFRYQGRDIPGAAGESGLSNFYNALIEEWKGLLGLIALYPEEITLSDPIHLVEQEGDNKPFHFVPGLGDMLFNEVDLWKDPEKIHRGQRDAFPFIQLIYYRGHLVGATSPFTILFTATDYSDLPNGKDIPWYRAGKLDDPMRSGDLTDRQKQDLYLLTKNIVGTKFRDFEERLEGGDDEKKKSPRKVNYSGFKQIVREWRDKMKKQNPELRESGTLNLPEFASPYRPLFEVTAQLSLKDNRFSLVEPGKPASGEIFDPQKLLLDTTILMQFSPLESPQEDPVYYLPVYSKNNKEVVCHVALPLTREGLQVFQNRMYGILYGQNDAGATGPTPRLRAKILKSDNPAPGIENTIQVELELVVGGEKFPPLSRKYDTFKVEDPKHLVLWPNFFHRNWDRYYIYSEFPENLADNTRFQPILRDLSKEDPKDTQARGEMVFPSKDESYTQKLLYLVQPDRERDPATSNQYEIIRSSLPLYGFEVQKMVQGELKKAGVILLKDEIAHSNEEHYSSVRGGMSQTEVRIGIDFGSNNSCMYYADMNGNDVEPVEFRDHRLAVIKTKSKIKIQDEYLAEPNELYFFQNYPTQQGQLKSWLHEHNPAYIPEAYRNMEIAGGVPIFKPLIRIRKVLKDNQIQTDAGILHHSMKWLTDKAHTEKQEAFLKTIWIHAYADLFSEGLVPKELIWSYPGAFSSGETSHFRTLYNTVSNSSPVSIVTKVAEPMTEAEAVSNFVVNRGPSLGAYNMYLGIDVGGSSSDILLLASKSILSEEDLEEDPYYDRDTYKNTGYRLIRQSSVRLSAGNLADTVNTSEKFRKAIHKLAINPDSRLNLPHVDQILEEKESGAFFFNAIVDKMRTEAEFNQFYNEITKAAPEVFLIPAFITGLLTFYSGQLIGSAFEDHPELAEIEKIDLFPFGKGGRIFDWLSVNPGEAQSVRFWRNCLNEGIKSTLEDKKSAHDAIRKDGKVKKEAPKSYRLAKNEEVESYKKSEVAMGLVETKVVEIPKNMRFTSDIFGERGYLYEGNPVPVNDPLTNDHFAQSQKHLRYPTQFPEFTRFLKVFVDFLDEWTRQPSSKEQLIREANRLLHEDLKGFITSDSEYKKYVNDPVNYPFRHSMIIMEGLCYMEKVLIPRIVATWKK